MNPVLLKSVLAFVPVCLLLIGSAVSSRRKSTAASALQLIGAPPLLLASLIALYSRILLANLEP
jgi:hypothetical protein